jgi:hypothetical protein
LTPKARANHSRVPCPVFSSKREPVLFPPDLLAGSFTPVRHVPEDDDILCARGPFTIEGTPFMLPLTAMS